MARRNLKSVEISTIDVTRSVRVVDEQMAPVRSPAHALHATLNDHFVLDSIPVLPLGQRVAIISVLAALSWSVAGGAAYLLIH